MTTFTVQDLNNLPVTKEEEEAMQALDKPMLEVSPTTQDILNNLAIPQPTPPTKTNTPLWMDIHNLGAQLQQLATVIKGNSLNAEDQSLQECVSLTLQQAEWFKEMVKEVIDDVDMEYEIDSAVDSYFTNSFSLDDHVDITAEVENRIEEIVEEQLADLVSEKLRNLRITFD